MAQNKLYYLVEVTKDDGLSEKEIFDILSEPKAFLTKDVTKIDWLSIMGRVSKLEALEAGGVDNWEGYGEAFNNGDDDY